MRGRTYARWRRTRWRWSAVAERDRLGGSPAFRVSGGPLGTLVRAPFQQGQAASWHDGPRWPGIVRDPSARRASPLLFRSVSRGREAPEMASAGGSWWRSVGGSRRGASGEARCWDARSSASSSGNGGDTLPTRFNWPCYEVRALVRVFRWCSCPESYPTLHAGGLHAQASARTD